jgi:hypothetical protein
VLCHRKIPPQWNSGHNITTIIQALLSSSYICPLISCVLAGTCILKGNSAMVFFVIICFCLWNAEPNQQHVGILIRHNGTLPANIEMVLVFSCT